MQPLPGPRPPTPAGVGVGVGVGGRGVGGKELDGALWEVNRLISSCGRHQREGQDPWRDRTRQEGGSAAQSFAFSGRVSLLHSVLLASAPKTFHGTQ